MVPVKIFFVFVFWAAPLLAEQTPFVELVSRNTGSLFTSSNSTGTSATGSLFSGEGSKISLIAPYTARRTHQPRRNILQNDSWQVVRLRHLIQQAESRRDGYDAVQLGARIKPGKPPTQMTLREIFQWIKATPKQPHAIGRYQFIPKTLGRLVTVLDLGPDIVFSPQIQDRLADVLLEEAGLRAAKDGRLSRYQFMNNLAKIWAGFPLENGKSYYHGFAGNKASITWAQFDAEMARIFPG